MTLPEILHAWPLEGLLAILAGIVILLVPRLLNVAIAAYLIAVGLLGLTSFWFGQPLPIRALIALVAGILVLLRPAVLSYVVGLYLILSGLFESGLVSF